MIMLPGLALFYGGLVRRKNVLSTIMHSFFGLAIVSVVWVLVGFSIAFAPDVNGMGLLGNLDYVGFFNVGLTPSTVYATTIPFILFAAFQLMFAAITPALITGAFAERKRFASFVLFTILWSILIYSPIAHWVWATDGWLFKLGALDFAGGTVVHASSGLSALIVAILIGRRVANGERMEPHDVPMTVLGAGLLCYSATLLRERVRVDDALDVFAVHGVGGVFGAIATGVLATSAVQASYKGLIDGNAGQVLTQLIAVAATIAYAVVGTFVIVKVVDLILGIRISAKQEELGIDLAVHGEVAYQA